MSAITPLNAVPQPLAKVQWLLLLYTGIYPGARSKKAAFVTFEAINLPRSGTILI
jgi:hypothetical protein